MAASLVRGGGASRPGSVAARAGEQLVRWRIGGRLDRGAAGHLRATPSAPPRAPRHLQGRGGLTKSAGPHAEGPRVRPGRPCRRDFGDFCSLASNYFDFFQAKPSFLEVFFLNCDPYIHIAEESFWGTFF